MISDERQLEPITERKALFKEYFLVFLIIFIFLLALRLFTPILAPPEPFYYTKNDHYHYIKMAENPLRALGGSAGAPFCYRPLKPFIAWLLPFDLNINFQLITYISLYITGIVLYQLFKEEYSKILSFTGLTLFYSLEWAVRFALNNIYVPDSLAFFFIVLCFWAIKKSNYLVFAISLFLGVLTKEIVLFTIPVFLINEITILEIKYPIQKEILLRWFIIIAPSIAIFIILRLLIIPYPGSEYDFINLFQRVALKKRLKKIIRFDFNFYYSITIGAWGILLIFPFFNHKKNVLNWLKLYGLFIILVYCQMLFATDNERLIVAGFYPMILLNISGMKRLNEERNVKEWIFLCIALIYFGILLIISRSVF